MRSPYSKTPRAMPFLPVLMWTTALVLSSCPVAFGQFQTTAQSGAPAGAAESKVEAYPLTAANRDVLTAWQQRAAGRTDMRVAIDERKCQPFVFPPPSVQAQIQKELAAKNAVPAAPAPAPAI